MDHLSFLSVKFFHTDSMSDIQHSILLRRSYCVYVPGKVLIMQLSTSHMSVNFPYLALEALQF